MCTCVWYSDTMLAIDVPIGITFIDSKYVWYLVGSVSVTDI